MNYDLEAARLKKDWAENPRWKGVERGYSAEDVVRLRGSLHIEHTLARRGAEKLWKLISDEPFVNTLGALTGNQALQQVKAGLKAIYLSGWQVAADANIAGEMYPDQSLYPANSVPAVVRRINNTFVRADQIAHAEGKDEIDYFAPIVADAEAGFGGVLNAFELMKSMIEAGAAGVHFEDQLASVKKCGHMGGKVLVPTREAVEKLVAARLAADCLGVPTILLARTDAEAADLVTSDIDDNDKPFCTGERTVEGFYKTRNGLDQAVSRGLAYARYADLIWCETGKPDLAFAKAFADAIHAKFPDKMLAYNCSPSFNWKKNLDDATIARFQRELGAMGYKFQFITLAGFHSLNYSMFHLAHGYARNNMAAFVELQEAEFAAVDQGFTAVKHQREVGTGYFDAVTQDGPGQPVVDDRAQGIDRGRAILRRREEACTSPTADRPEQPKRATSLTRLVSSMRRDVARHRGVFFAIQDASHDRGSRGGRTVESASEPAARVFFALVPPPALRQALASLAPARSRNAPTVAPFPPTTCTSPWRSSARGRCPGCRSGSTPARVVPRAPMHVTLDALGGFRRAGVAWLGASVPPAPLLELGRGLNCGARRCRHRGRPPVPSASDAGAQMPRPVSARIRRPLRMGRRRVGADASRELRHRSLRASRCARRTSLRVGKSARCRHARPGPSPPAAAVRRPTRSTSRGRCA